MNLKKYLNVIRRTVIVNAFIEQYFLRIVVVYLLAKGVTPWVAVSLPVVLEFAKIISRGFKPIVELAIRINYKKYHLFYLVSLIVLCFIISQCTSVYTIYLFTLIYGTLAGINGSCITKLCTSNSKYESHCFVEEERGFVIGATGGLIVSQILYDVSPSLYIAGIVILGIIGVTINSSMANIKVEDDVMESIEETKELTKEEKNKTILVTVLFATMTGFWCMSISALNELTPLITNKVGYINALYTIVEIIALIFINGKIIAKIKNKNKLLFWEFIVAILDTAYLLIAALYQTNVSLIFVYFCMGISSTIGDPVWGSIVSSYSTNNRRKYVLINNVYFIIRGLFVFITWFVCRQCVIYGNQSFIYLSIAIAIAITTFYLIGNKVNKKIFGHTI